jgi:hypothetical protein
VEDLPVPSLGRSPRPPLTLTGTVEAGVERGCLLLDGYLLLGGDRTLIVAGARVTVTGRPEPGTLTTCQQGTPFRVETTEPA